jgi:DNA-binding transcriptional regulator YiaG
MAIHRIKKYRQLLKEELAHEADNHARIMGWPVFPSQIRELRARLKLTQGRFAALVGVRLNTVWRWENGHIQASNEKLRAMIRRESERKALTA